MQNEMRIAKGINGIRKFLAFDAENTGWHVTTRTEYVEWNDTQTAKEIIVEWSAKGYTFVGWTGNGICFDKCDSE